MNIDGLTLLLIATCLVLAVTTRGYATEARRERRARQFLQQLLASKRLELREALADRDNAIQHAEECQMLVGLLGQDIRCTSLTLVEGDAS